MSRYEIMLNHTWFVTHPVLYTSQVSTKGQNSEFKKVRYILNKFLAHTRNGISEKTRVADQVWTTELSVDRRLVKLLRYKRDRRLLDFYQILGINKKRDNFMNGDRGPISLSFISSLLK